MICNIHRLIALFNYIICWECVFQLGILFPKFQHHSWNLIQCVACEWSCLQKLAGQSWLSEIVFNLNKDPHILGYKECLESTDRGRPFIVESGHYVVRKFMSLTVVTPGCTSLIVLILKESTWKAVASNFTHFSVQFKIQKLNFCCNILARNAPCSNARVTYTTYFLNIYSCSSVNTQCPSLSITTSPDFCSVGCYTININRHSFAYKVTHVFCNASLAIGNF